MERKERFRIVQYDDGMTHVFLQGKDVSENFNEVHLHHYANTEETKLSLEFNITEKER